MAGVARRGAAAGCVITSAPSWSEATLLQTANRKLILSSDLSAQGSNLVHDCCGRLNNHWESGFQRSQVGLAEFGQTRSGSRIPFPQCNNWRDFDRLGSRLAEFGRILPKVPVRRVTVIQPCSGQKDSSNFGMVSERLSRGPVRRTGNLRALLECFVVASATSGRVL